MRLWSKAGYNKWLMKHTSTTLSCKYENHKGEFLPFVGRLIPQKSALFANVISVLDLKTITYSLYTRIYQCYVREKNDHIMEIYSFGLHL